MLYEKDVIITYGWNRVAYNVLRSLARQGLSVCVADHSTLGMSLWSKFANKRLIYPSFYHDSHQFVDWMEQSLLKYRPRVYIPIHEEIFIISKHLNRLEQTGTIIPISDFETLRKVHLKNELMNLAKQLNIPTPLTLQPQNLEDARNFAKCVKFPIVVKMLNTNSSKGVFYCHSIETLVKKFEELSNGLSQNQYPILQEYVSGEGYGVSLLLNRGKTRAVFAHKRLREKTFTGGTSSKRISIRNQALEKHSTRLLESIGFHGVAMVEFKYDEKSNKAWLLEVNPRFWGSLALPIAAGVNFPFLLYQMAIHGDIKFHNAYKENVIVRWILGDVLATLSTIQKTRNLLKPIRDFCTFDEKSFDDLYLDDPLPFFMEMVYYFSKFIKTGSSNPTTNAVVEVEAL